MFHCHGLPMKNKIWLNKEVAKILKITKRQVLSWSEKGLIVPFEESTGVGTKRGYDYTNLLEYALCKKLFSLGIGFRAVKIILGDIRANNMLKEWAEDYLSYFKKMWTTGGPFGLGHLNIDKPTDSKLIELGVSLQLILVYEPIKMNKATGIFIYFFSGIFNKRPCILPKVRLYGDQKIIKASHFIFSFLTQHEDALLINIGKIKDDVDNELNLI